MTKSLTTELHWTLLEKAAKRIEAGAFNEYFELRRLLASTDVKDRPEFQRRFANYYRLGIGGLTDAFKRQYFELLFSCAPVGQEDPYTPLLLKLHGFKTRRGHRALQASFVSKLVSMHDESRPIYDRHVSDFFGLRVPSVAHPTDVRIAGCVSILGRIQGHYEEWAADRRFRDLETVLFRKQPMLKDCHRTRICDFLVWTVGDRKLT